MSQPQPVDSALPLCRYGSSCYRRNPDHTKLFRHPIANASTSTSTSATGNPIDDSQQTRYRPQQHFQSPSVPVPVPAPVSVEPAPKKARIAIEDAELSNKTQEIQRFDQKTNNAIDEQRDQTETETVDEADADADADAAADDPSPSSSVHPSIEFPSLVSLSLLSHASRISVWRRLLSLSFGLAMPDEFFDFFEFAVALHQIRAGCRRCATFAAENQLASSQNTIESAPDENSLAACLSDVLHVIPGFSLCGPFEVLAGKFANRENSNFDFDLHWRFFHDFPEAQTIAVTNTAAAADGDQRESTKFESREAGKDGQQSSSFSSLLAGSENFVPHYFYWRDDPTELPSFVGCCDQSGNGEIRVCGGSMFSVLLSFMEKMKFRDENERQIVESAKKLLIAQCEALRIELFQSSDRKKRISPLRDEKYLARKKRVVCDTFNCVGLVVPVTRRGKNEVGYRPMHLSAAELTKLVNRMRLELDSNGSMNFDALDSLNSLIAFAHDECDFGCGLEFYSNIYTIGDHLDNEARKGMKLAYDLLNRGKWAEIIDKHIKTRKNRNPNQWKEIGAADQTTTTATSTLQH